MPSPNVGSPLTESGGQSAVHGPVHTLLFFLSGVKR